MLEDPSVSQYLVPKEIMVQFIESQKAGTPNYDLVLDPVS